MPSTISHTLETLVVSVDMATFTLRQDWISLRSGAKEDLILLANTSQALPGMLRIKKVTDTSDRVIEIIEYPVDLP